MITTLRVLGAALGGFSFTLIVFQFSARILRAFWELVS